MVRETRHGPVLSDLDGTEGPVLAVAMANLAPGDSAAAGLLALNRAGSVAEAGVASALISAPVQNMLVADKGGIGQFTTGRVPVRRAGDGTLPVPGADGAHDWVGFASGEALPRVVGPASGRIVNANERVAGAGFPVFLGQDWYGDWRARRIRALLDARSTHSVASFAAMQVDSVSAFAQAVMPRLMRTAAADGASRAALASLQRWDMAVRVERAQPLLFNDWIRRIESALLARGRPAGRGAGAAGECGGAGAGGGGGVVVRAGVRRDADDDAGRGGGGAGCGGGLGGRAPGGVPACVAGASAVGGGLFTWGVEQPGDDTTVFRGSMRGPGWESVHGPSYRGVYDLADLDRSVFALAPGQSGHPFRRLAGSLMRRWKDGTTLKLGPVAAAAEWVELRP